MKRVRHCLHCTKKELLQIHLVDKCLILFMLVLLAQSAYTLFSAHSLAKESSDIDVIVRTSSAAIFGYFLSANFIRRSSLSKGAPELQKSPENPLPEDTAASGQPDIQTEAASRLQIIAATTIGLFCMITLLILRDSISGSSPAANNASITATVTQFRDFVSGCVGFLIGCPTCSSSINNS